MCPPGSGLRTSPLVCHRPLSSCQVMKAPRIVQHFLLRVLTDRIGKKAVEDAGCLVPSYCPVQAAENRCLPVSSSLCPAPPSFARAAPAWLLRYLQKTPSYYFSLLPTFCCRAGCVNQERLQRASSGPTPVWEWRISPAPATFLI